MSRETARTELARTLHKALRQFEFEGCPETFDLAVHIDVMLTGLEQAGYRLVPELKVLENEAEKCPAHKLVGNNHFCRG